MKPKSKLQQLRERNPWKAKPEPKGRGRKQVNSAFNPAISKKHNADMSKLAGLEFQHRLTFER